MEADRRELLRNLMTSPVEDFEPFENEDEILGDTTVRQDDEEDEGEELFGDNMENDYRPRPELDRYDRADLDDDDFSDISESDRRAAEGEMFRRDRAMVCSYIYSLSLVKDYTKIERNVHLNLGYSSRRTQFDL